MSGAEHPFPWSEDAVCRPSAENGLLPCCRGEGLCQAPPDIGPCDPLPTEEYDRCRACLECVPAEIAACTCPIPPADGGTR